jgi:uncharacterized protein YecA (UPF0149 family)
VAGPCPVCGGRGHIPDGLYNFVGQTIELLSGPASTVADLQKLAAILERARQQRADHEEVSAAIAREAPAFTGLGTLLPTNRNELYGFITMVLTAIGVILAAKAGQSKVEVNQVVNVIATAPAQAPPRISQNAPCPCGSGKKFRECHGKQKGGGGRR